MGPDRGLAKDPGKRLAPSHPTRRRQQVQRGISVVGEALQNGAPWPEACCQELGADRRMPRRHQTKPRRRSRSPRETAQTALPEMQQPFDPLRDVLEVEAQQ